MRPTVVLVLATLCLVPCAWGQTDPEEPAVRSQLAKIDEFKAPPYVGESDDLDYKKSWIARFLGYLEKRNTLIWDFVKAFPDHERSKPLMEEWFSNLAGGTTPPIFSRINKAVLEIDSLLVHQPPEWVVTMGHYYRAYFLLCQAWNRLITLDSVGAPADDRERRAVVEFGVRQIEEFTTKHPTELRAVRLFDILAEASNDPVSARAIYARILNDYPDYPTRALYEGKMRRTDKIGDAFEMTFEDALTGDIVRTEDYKDKVLLVVFWANSVPECRRLMKEAKRLWFKYEHEGLEIVDISLDTLDGGGKKAYNDFVKDNKMSWKHFFQGSGIESEFSKGWGINSLPTWFLVDRQGKLRYTDAHRDTETKVKDLLKEKTSGEGPYQGSPSQQLLSTLPHLAH